MHITPEHVSFGFRLCNALVIVIAEKEDKNTFNTLLLNLRLLEIRTYIKEIYIFGKWATKTCTAERGFCCFRVFPIRKTEVNWLWSVVLLYQQNPTHDTK